LLRLLYCGTRRGWARWELIVPHAPEDALLFRSSQCWVATSALPQAFPLLSFVVFNKQVHCASLGITLTIGTV
ncbi:hypothetical protein ABXW19_12235, partial [Streptococcus suis]|uniref:hypothetical protein n=1 Tax=Streptococcus suis TaxID=1307 RepID=UPI003CE75333